MKKIFICLFIFSLMPLGCFFSVKTKEAVVDSFDDGMEMVFEQYSSLELAKIELSMLVFEMTDIEAIFAKFHEVDNKVVDLQKTIAQVETLSEEMNSQKVGSSNTAYAEGDYSQEAMLKYSYDTGQKRYGILKDFGNWVMNNQYRDQDEAMRMGIYAGYKEIQKQSPGDAEEYIDPVLKELGIEKIEDIFYCDFDKVETFYNSKTKELPEGYGQNFRSQKEDVYEDLREGTTQDVYTYLDQVTSMIGDEIEAEKYGEYVPKHIADFAIRTIGFENYVNYIEERRQNCLQLSNTVTKEEEKTPDLMDFFGEYEDENGDTSYFSEGYEKNDSTEVVVAYNKDTDQFLLAKIDTDKSNEINLPPGEYDILATTDENVPAYSDSVEVEEGNTTTVHNTTAGITISPDLLNFLASSGRSTFVLPTKADLKAKENQLVLKLQLKANLEYQLEILRSMEGGSFTYVSPEAKTKLSNQLDDLETDIEALEKEVGDLKEVEGLMDLTEEESDSSEASSDNKYPAFLDAIGSWSSSKGGGGGSIDIEFPSAGGPITGHFGGCPNGVCWSSTATGEFDGQEGGSVSGSIDGYMEATQYTPAFSISGSFSGTVNLKAGTASGTFGTTLSGGGKSYTDGGSFNVTFDNGLSNK